MQTKRFLGLGVVLSLFVVAGGCGVDSDVGIGDEPIGECDAALSGEDCEGSQAPHDDGSVDEAAPDASDVDDPDAAHGDGDGDGDAQDGSVDEEDAAVDPESDASVETDSGVDAAIDAPSCHDDYECGYGTCLDGLDPAVCDCAIGYRDDGAGCEWSGDGETGGVKDSELEDASAWSGSGFAIAGGVATFDSSGAGDSCEVGVLQQLVQMPARAASQAFVVELDVLSSCTSGDAEECPALQLELGASATRLVVAGDPDAAAAPVARTAFACIGQAGYGPDVMLRVRPALAYHHGEQPLSCESSVWPAIDRIAIRAAAAGECASDDALLGGLASSAGWVLANATIASGQLNVAQGGRAETVVAFSELAQSQALKLHVVAPPPRVNQVVDVQLDGLTWGRMRMSGDMTICMPEWAAGASHRVAISALTRDVVITELAIGSVEACGDNAFDAQLERPVAGSSWSTSDGLFGAATGYDGTGIGISASTALLASFRFPARETTYRFGLHAMYRNQPSQSATVDFALDATSGETSNDASWQERTGCVPNRFEHQLVTLRLDVAMMPMAAGGDVYMSLDDLGLRHPGEAGCE